MDIKQTLPVKKNKKSYKAQIEEVFKLSKFSPFIIYTSIFLFSRFLNNASVIGGIISTLLWGTIINFLLERVLYSPMRSVKFGKIVKNMKAEIGLVAFTPTLTYSRIRPVPMLLAVDKVQQKILIRNASTEYETLTLDANQIIGAKVERETEIRSTTKHELRASIFDSRSYSGTSQTTNEVIEYAYLELYYEVDKQSAAKLIVIPFGVDRRDADSMLIAIEQIRGNL